MREREREREREFPLSRPVHDKILLTIGPGHVTQSNQNPHVIIFRHSDDALMLIRVTLPQKAKRSDS